MVDDSDVGISGMALYVPPFRVCLEDWCDWTGNRWDKISAVVGRSFRQPGLHESIYTMAANAVLRLIDRYQVNPAEVGLLAFGTESSTDNAAGAIIVRGMVDRALEGQGRPRLRRSCEVPELKHACLGGIYAIKSALRYLATDGQGKKAIVVTGDIAEYERGSSGEQTQGAGTVALLLENNPKLCTIDLRQAGSSSDYRGVDFRKPFARHAAPHYTPNVGRLHDFPVFNGKYSTYCYLDAVTHAVQDMLERRRDGCVTARACYRNTRAILFHRPYHWMPIQAMASLYVWALGAEAETDGEGELAGLCEKAGADIAEVRRETTQSRDLLARVLRDGIDVDPYPESTKVAKVVRKDPSFVALQEEKMSLGADRMKDIGNIYTAALPAWAAAMFDDALQRNVSLAGATVLTIGYGSGDAAEAIPMRVVEGWQQAAQLIRFGEALAGSITLNRAQYEALHDGQPPPDLSYQPRNEFHVTEVGQQVAPEFQDIGIEYYAYAAAEKHTPR